ncbi:MAG: hypothetical protein KDD22_00265 [Bdellovibrionales bacterium]|nr:hypothetical protein [Bdellovibrionales bacterium]
MTDQISVEQALKEFYGTQHLGDEAFTQAVNYAQFGSLKIPFPNLKKRREIIYLHDINHLLTGYDTTYAGEGELAAYELASGFPFHCWVGYLYAPIAFLTGVFVAPLRVWRGWLRGWGAKNSCHADLTREEIFSMNLGELRQYLQIPL